MPRAEEIAKAMAEMDRYNQPRATVVEERYEKRVASVGGSYGGLAELMSQGRPGNWASDHKAEAEKYAGWHYVAISAIGKAIRSCDVEAYQEPQRNYSKAYNQEDDDSAPLPKWHPLMKILKRPSASQSGASFREEVAIQLCLTGSALIWNVPNQMGRTVERYVIPTAIAEPRQPERGLPKGGWHINPEVARWQVENGWFLYTGLAQAIGKVIDARDVQVIRFIHPTFKDEGQSPVSAGALWTDTSEKIDVSRHAHLRNGSDPSVIIGIDGVEDESTLQRMSAKFNEKYAGPSKHGKAMFVNGQNVKVEPVTRTPAEMAYEGAFAQFRDAIMALHGVTPIAAGIEAPSGDDGLYAPLKQFIAGTVQPILDLMAEEDTEQLASQFGEGLTVFYTARAIDDAKLTEQQINTDIAAGAIEVDEIRKLRGRKPWGGEKGKAVAGQGPKQEGPGGLPGLPQGVPGLDAPKPLAGPQASAPGQPAQPAKTPEQIAEEAVAKALAAFEDRISGLLKSGSDCGANGPGGGGFQAGNSCASGDGSGGATTKPKKSSAVTESEAFKRWFKGSEVVDEDGNPLIVHHSTNAKEFDEFRTAGLAAHFGDAGAAEARQQDLADFSENVVGRDAGQFRTIEAYLSIKSPLEMPDLAGLYMTERGEIIGADEVEDRLDEFPQDDPDDPQMPYPMSWESDEDFSTYLRDKDYITTDQFWDCQYSKDKAVEFLKENGYDGIKYENAVENPGSISWIPFDANQIKSAKKNSGEFSASGNMFKSSACGANAQGGGGFQPGNTCGKRDGSAGESQGGDARKVNAKVLAWAKEKFGDEKVAENFARWFGDSKFVDENGEPIAVYHGTSTGFTEFRNTGARLPSIGYGFYFSPDADVASTYATGESPQVMQVYLQADKVLDWDNLSKSDREAVENRLVGIVPDDRLAGFGSPQQRTFSREQDDEAEAFYRKKKKETAHLYHDRAKARVDFTEDGTVISWMEPGLGSATDSNLRTLAQEYDMQIGESLGYDAVRSGLEIVVFSPNQIKSATGNSGTFDPDNPNITKSGSGCGANQPGGGGFRAGNTCGKEDGGSGDSGSSKVRQWAEKKFKDKQTAENFVKWFGDSKVVDENGEPLVMYHGAEDYRGEVDGIFVTDDPAMATRYAELKAVERAVSENSELEEIVYEVMGEEGADTLTDLGPERVKEIAEANGFEIPDAEGKVDSLWVRSVKPLDLREYGSDVGDVGELWDSMHQAGLLDDSWDSLDEEARYEVESQYDGKALYNFLEDEGIQAKAFKRGYDSVVFVDIAPDGGATHDSWLVKEGNQVKSDRNSGKFSRESKDVTKSAPKRKSASGCGANAQGGGGFQPGNTCASGGGGDESGDDYRGNHRAPNREGGAPLSDMTGNGEVYPDDIYGPKAAQYYGTGEPVIDKKTVKIIQSLRGKPDAEVTIYRAVPKDAGDKINPGDWVTINREYATMHGEGALRGEYRILELKARAADIYGNGDSIHEYGYDPAERSKSGSDCGANAEGGGGFQPGNTCGREDGAESGGEGAEKAVSKQKLTNKWNQLSAELMNASGMTFDDVLDKVGSIEGGTKAQIDWMQSEVDKLRSGAFTDARKNARAELEKIREDVVSAWATEEEKIKAASSKLEEARKDYDDISSRWVKKNLELRQATTAMMTNTSKENKDRFAAIRDEEDGLKKERDEAHEKVKQLHSEKWEIEKKARLEVAKVLANDAESIVKTAYDVPLQELRDRHLDKVKSGMFTDRSTTRAQDDAEQGSQKKPRVESQEFLTLAANIAIHENALRATVEYGDIDRAHAVPEHDGQKFYDLLDDGLSKEEARAEAIKAGKVVLSYGEDVSTYLHEYAHQLEFNSREVRDTAKNFLMERVSGDKFETLSAVFANSGYGPNERGADDNFGRAFKALGYAKTDGSYDDPARRAYYAGKYYKDGFTETISMGIELFHKNPAEFANADPEWFDLVTGVLTGRLLPKTQERIKARK
jgi:phage portal protein BeeE